MSLAYDILYAQKCRSTHHKIAMDALMRLRTDDRQRWIDLFIYYVDWYLDGAKAPDTKFKDFRNHVLHVNDNYWGGACKTAQSWYDKTIDLFQRRDWPAAVYSAGVLSHYFSDPFQPFHTGQSEAEGVVHRAEEWSICKSYEQLRKLIETNLGYPEWEIPAGDDWLTQMIRQGAEAGHAHYEVCIDHYNIDLGVKNPPAGLDDEIRERIASQIALATVGFARVLERIIHDAGATADSVPVMLTLALSTANMPVQAVRDFVDGRAERIRIGEMYAEFKVNGKVVNTLPEDDRAIRKLHAAEVLKTPIAKLDAEKTRAPGSKFGSFEPRRETQAAMSLGHNLAPRCYNTNGEPINERGEVIRRIDSPVTSAFVGSAGRGSFSSGTYAGANGAIAAGTLPHLTAGVSLASKPTSSNRRQVMVVGSSISPSVSAARTLASQPSAGKKFFTSLDIHPSGEGPDDGDERTNSFTSGKSSGRGPGDVTETTKSSPTSELNEMHSVNEPISRSVADPTEGLRTARGSSLLGSDGSGSSERNRQSSGTSASKFDVPDRSLSASKRVEPVRVSRLLADETQVASDEDKEPRESASKETAPRTGQTLPVPELRPQRSPAPESAEAPRASAFVSRPASGGSQANTTNSSTAAEIGPQVPLETIQSEAAREAEALAQMLRASGVVSSGTGNSSAVASSLLSNRSGSSAAEDGNRSRSSTSESESRRSGTSSSSSSSSSQRSEREPRESQSNESDRGERSRRWKHYLNLDDDLEAAPSIGRKTAIRFAKMGIHTVRDFLNADPDEMADKIDKSYMSAAILRDWQSQARLNVAIPNLRGHDAQILVGCGIREPGEVAAAAADVLFDFVNEYVNTSEGQRILRGGSLPDLAEVKSWIEWAQEARPIES